MLGNDPYSLRSSQPGDEEQLLGLFNKVFRGNGSPEPPRRREFWSWRYADSGPQENHSSVAVRCDDGSIIGHVGGVCLATWCRGEVRPTSVSVDNMIDPERRRGLQRVGVFARLVNHWVDSYFGCDRDFIAWGFPTTSNFRIGQKFSRYSLVRPINVLVARDLGRLRRPVKGVESRRAAAFGPEYDALWERCRETIEMGVVRSSAYLGWRYVQHPEHRYRVHEARDSRSGELRGFAVTRSGGLAPDVVQIMDWLVEEGDGEAEQCLRCACADEAIEADAGGLIAWIPEGLPGFARFQRRGFYVEPTPIIMVARSWDRRISVVDVRQRFYATLGDIDYY